MSSRGWAVAGAVVSLALALAVFDFYLFTGGDNVAYYALTKALATGRGYVDLITPGAPPASQYPPGYPLALVPLYWIFGGAYTPLKIMSFAAGAVALWGLWSVARRETALPAWGPAAAIWLFGLYPVFRIYTHWVLSDMTFVAVSLVALALYGRAGEKEGAGPALDRPGGAWAAASLMGLFAFYVRTAGITVPLAALAWAVWRRSWRRAAVAAVVLLVGAAPWFVWMKHHPPETGGYMQQLTSVRRLDPTSDKASLGVYFTRAIDNSARYARDDLPQMIWPLAVPPAAGNFRPAPLPVRIFGGLLLGALVALGVVLALRRRGLAVRDLYAGLTLGVILVWSWTGDRFFLTVAPLLFLYSLVGLAAAVRMFTSSSRPAVAAVALIALVQVGGALREVPPQLRLTRAWLDGDEMGGYEPFWQDYFEAARWIGDNAPDAVIVARKPTFAWYWSGERPSFVYPFRDDPDVRWNAIRRHGATHLIMEDISRVFLTPTLEPHLDALEVVHASPRRMAMVIAIHPEQE